MIISSITNIIATLNGAAVTIPGGLMGTTNSPVTTSAGTFTAFVQCKVPTDCDGVLDPTFINDLHFTVTNVTIAQLTVANDDGNVFLASLPLQVPEPATVALLGLGLAGIGFARRARSTH